MVIRSLLLLCALIVLPSFSHAQVPYYLVAAESNSGSLGGNTALYGGLQQYHFTASGAPATVGGGLAASALSDPVGVLYHQSTLLVSNRVGNTLGQGTIQRITVTNDVDFSAGPVIASASSPSFQGFHGFSFSPINQDLFVTTVNSGTRRYRDNGSGYADIGGVASGAVRDVLISPDGTKMYETDNGTLRVTEVLPNGFGTTSLFTVTGASGMHQMTFHNGAIYASAFTSGSVHRIDLDANFLPVGSTNVASSPAAIGIAFSPDGQEMYVSGHTTNQINRFLLNAGNWVPNGSITTGHNMGYVAVVPVPEPMLALAIGLVGLATLRQKHKNGDGARFSIRTQA